MTHPVDGSRVTAVVVPSAAVCDRTRPRASTVSEVVWPSGLTVVPAGVPRPRAARPTRDCGVTANVTRSLPVPENEVETRPSAP